MKIMILGTGGIGSYYGTKLLNAGNDVIFIARGEHLKAIRKNGLTLSHPSFNFSQTVNVYSLDEITPELLKCDLIIIATKSTTTVSIATELSELYTNIELPYILSLQNGVENEDILCDFFPKDKIIGGLTRKIGAHIIKAGVIESTGNVETILGSIKKTTENIKFIKKLSLSIKDANILCEIVDDIKIELWKKLIINNGVNAICALLEIKTGVLMHHEKLAKIVYGLMCETAKAAEAVNISISEKDVISMFELIKNFDSIKPSMLIDKEFNRPLEIDEICGVVIKYNKKQTLDAPYTRTISTILNFLYSE